MVKQPDIKNKINSLNEQASSICEENPQQAITLAKEAQHLSRSDVFRTEPYQRGIACSTAIIAKAHSHLGEYSLAIELGLQALTLAQIIDDIDAMSCSLEALGIAYRDLEDWSAAIETQLQRLEIARRIASSLEEAHALNRLGSIYSHMGRFEDALHQYEIALPIFEAADDKIALARIHHNSCIEYRELGRYEKALEQGLLALKLYIEGAPEQIKSRARTHVIVADAYAKLERYEEAIQHCEQAISAVAEDGISYTLMAAQFTYGQIHQSLENVNEAIAYFGQSLFMGEELQTPSFIYESHHELAKLYKTFGDFERALEHFEQFHEIKEAYFNETSHTKVRNLEISHRTRETQQELEQQKRLRDEDRRYFERLNTMKDEVLHGVSHDLKSPLSSIKTSIYLLSRHGNTLDEKGKELLERIESSANQMQQLISNILDLAQLETGRSLETRPILFMPLLKAIVAEHNHQLEKRTIKFERQPDMDSVFIEADEQLLKRAMSNLLSNAIKYTDSKGTIEIVLHKDAEEITVAIRDNGIGIAKEDLPHIFERFYRAKNSALAIEGTGLGLSIAYTIFEQHRGRLWVNSMEGIGTTFSFALPTVVVASV